MSGVHGLDLFDLACMGDVGAMCADFDCRDLADFGELLCHGWIVVADTCVGLGFFFVGEDDIDVVFKDVREYAFGGVDDLEGGEIEADRAACGFRAFEHAHH